MDCSSSSILLLSICWTREELLSNIFNRGFKALNQFGKSLDLFSRYYDRITLTACKIDVFEVLVNVSVGIFNDDQIFN